MGIESKAKTPIRSLRSPGYAGNGGIFFCGLTQGVARRLALPWAVIFRPFRAGERWATVHLLFASKAFIQCFSKILCSAGPFRSSKTRGALALPMRSMAVMATASGGVVRDAEVMLPGKISVFQLVPERV
jgi:hypothetical protein